MLAPEHIYMIGKFIVISIIIFWFVMLYSGEFRCCIFNLWYHFYLANVANNLRTETINCKKIDIQGTGTVRKQVRSNHLIRLFGFEFHFIIDFKSLWMASATNYCLGNYLIHCTDHTIPVNYACHYEFSLSLNFLSLKSFKYRCMFA